MSMKYFVRHISTICLIFAFSFKANSDKLNGLNASNLRLSRVDNSLWVKFDVNIKNIKLDRHYRARVQPVIYKDTNCELMPKFTITGSAKYLMEKRDSLFKRPTISEYDFSSDYKQGSKSMMSYQYALPYKEWMDTVSIRFDNVIENCCSSHIVDSYWAFLKMVPENLVTTHSSEDKNGIVNTTYSRVKIAFESIIQKAKPIKSIVNCDEIINNINDFELKIDRLNPTLRTDTVMLLFKKDQAYLKHKYKDNLYNISKIINLITNINLSKFKQLEKIKLVANSAIYDVDKYNDFIVKKRLESLREFLVGKLGIKSSMVEMENSGVCWNKLSELVGNSNLPFKDSLINIFNSDKSSIEKIGMLSLYDSNDLYRRVLQTYSNDYSNMAFVVIVYSDNNDANGVIIEDAIDMIFNHNIDQALTELHKIENDSRIYNPIGVAYQLKGDIEKAMYYLKKGAEYGDSRALDNLKKLNKILR